MADAAGVGAGCAPPCPDCSATASNSACSSSVSPLSSIGRTGAAAVRALGLYRDDYSLRRVRQAVEQKNDPLVEEAFSSEFGAL